MEWWAKIGARSISRILEHIALHTAQLLDAIFHLTGKQAGLSVDGGLINNTYFCQFLADVTQCKITVPVSPDIPACGTGRLALIGSGVAKDLSDLTPAPKPQKIIPGMPWRAIFL